MKKIALFLVFVVILIGGGAFYLGANIEPLIKAAVEKYGSEATQAKVRLGAVHLSLKDGAGSLEDFSVGNPEGFSSDKAISFGRVAIQVDVKSIAGKGPIVIHKILVEKPVVRYELANDGSNNLGTIAKNAKAYGASKMPASAKESKPEPKSEASGEGRKIVIENLDIKGGEVGVAAEILKGKSLNVPLSDIHMSNIGKSNGGMSREQMASFLFDLVGSSASQAAQAGLTKAVAGDAAQQVQKAGGKLLGHIFGK
jgi:uncharacterized protein involved in outer membrane biogenesis